MGWLKWVLRAVCALMLLSGTWWILQGTGIAPVGFMARRMEWAYIGIVVDVVAIVLLVLTYRRGKSAPPSA
jgi:hypothetical protein